MHGLFLTCQLDNTRLGSIGIEFLNKINASASVLVLGMLVEFEKMKKLDKRMNLKIFSIQAKCEILIRVSDLVFVDYYL